MKKSTYAVVIITSLVAGVILARLYGTMPSEVPPASVAGMCAATFILAFVVLVVGLLVDKVARR